MTTDAKRKQELGLIHAGKKALAMDDDTYRALLEKLTGKRSAADLDWKQRKAVIDHLRASGYQPATRRTAPEGPKGRLISKIKAQLMSFHPARGDEYADAIARRMFKVERYTWCTPEQLSKIIAALAYQQNKQQERDDALKQIIDDALDKHAP